jgi:phosphatidate cytidylyltransferase
MGAVFFGAAFFLPPIALWALALLLTAVGLREFYAMARSSGSSVFAGTGLALGALWVTVVFVDLNASVLPAMGAFRHWESCAGGLLLLCLFARLFAAQSSSDPLRSLGLTLFGIAYVPVLLSFMVRLALWETPTEWLAPIGVTGRRLLLYAVVVVKCSDIGAYTAGRLAGRRPMFPRLSPKKTWEGFWGGMATAVGTSVLFSVLGGSALGALPFGLAHAVTLGLLLGATSVTGDLFESLIKRSAGAKDSSGLIPGNGGMLDVFDSLLFTAPVVYVYARILTRV